MSLFEGSNILVSSSNFSLMGHIYLEEGDVFDVSFPSEANFQIGDEITATLYHRNGILTFQSAVIAAVADNRVLLIKPSRDTTLLNRRRYERFDVEVPADIQMGDRTFTATVLDLSIGGMRFTTDVLIEEGMEMHVQIKEDDLVMIQASGISRRVTVREGISVVGLEFHQVEGLHTRVEQYLRRYEQTKFLKRYEAARMDAGRLRSV